MRVKKHHPFQKHVQTLTEVEKSTNIQYTVGYCIVYSILDCRQRVCTSRGEMGVGDSSSMSN